MKNIRYILLSIALAACTTGCYRAEVDQINKEIESLRNVQIASLSDQVKSVSSSLEDLEGLSAELIQAIAELEEASEGLKKDIAAIDSKIDAVKTSLGDKISSGQAEVFAELTSAKSALETQLASVEAALVLLQQKYADLTADMETLEQYAEGTFATKDWVSGTFVTIEAQNALIEDIRTIELQLIELDTVSIKFQKEIFQMIDKCAAEALEHFDDDIAARVASFKLDFQSAYDKALASIESAFSEKLQKDIKANENKIKNWVSEELTAKYYTVASAKAQIEVYKALIGAVPEGETLQGQIDALSEAIRAAESQIKAEYTKAIQEAIEESEGKLSEELASAIAKLTTEVLNPVTESIKTLESDVDKLFEDLGKLTERVNTLEEQEAAIEKSLAVAKAAEEATQAYIDALKAKLQSADSTNYVYIKGLIDDLESKLRSGEGSLKQQIADLSAYIGTIPEGQTSVVEWWENSMKTIDAQFALLATTTYFDAEIDKIEELIGTHDTQISALQDRVDKILDDLQATTEEWLSKSLASYYTGAKVQDTLSVLKTTYLALFDEADKALLQKLSTLETKLGTEVSALQNEYKAAIEETIKGNDGYVTDTIKVSLEKAKTRIDNLWASINDEGGVVKKIEAILADIATLNSSLGTARTDVDDLEAFVKESGYNSLKELVQHLQEQLDSLDIRYASLTDLQNLYNLVYGEGGTAQNPADGSLMAQVGQINQLAIDLKAAEGQLETLNKCLENIDLKSEDAKTLKQMIDAIQNSLTSLKTTISGTGGVKEQIAALNKAIYGDGTSAGTATEGSVFYKLSQMEKMLAASQASLASIAYVPEFGDGMATITPDDNGGYDVSFNFIVKPSNLASVFEGILSKKSEGSRMRFISTPTRSVEYLDFDSVTYSSSTDSKNKNIAYLSVDAKIGSKYKELVQKGASAILFVNATYEDYAYDFASDFIPMVEIASQSGFYLDPKEMAFDGDGSADTLKAYYSNENTTKVEVTSKPDWISEAKCIASSGSPWAFKLTADKNTTGSFRYGSVVVTYTYTYKTWFETKTYTEDRTLTVYQERLQQKLEFRPDTLNLAFNGCVYTEEGKLTSSKTAKVKVLVKGASGEWEVGNHDDWFTAARKAMTGSGSDVVDTLVISTPQNYTGKSLRTGKVSIKSSTEVPYEYTVVQQPRGTQTLTFNPADTIRLAYTSGSSEILTVSPSDFENDWTYEGIVYKGTATNWLKCEQDKDDKCKFTLSTTAESIADTARVCTLTFKCAEAGGGKVYNIPVQQAGRNAQILTITPAGPMEFNFRKGQTGTVSVSSSDGLTDWTYSITDEEKKWLQITEPETRTNPVDVTFTTLSDFESSDDYRTATVAFKTKAGAVTNYIVKQARRPEQTLTFKPEKLDSLGFKVHLEDSLLITSSDGRTDFADKGKITLSEDVDWLKVTTRKNADSTVTMKFYAQENTEEEERKITVYIRAYHFTSEYTPYSFEVVQKGVTPQSIESITPDPLYIACDKDAAGTTTIVTTDGELPKEPTLTCSEDWLSGSISGSTATFTASQNDGADDRQCTVTYTLKNGNSKTATVIQRGKQTLALSTEALTLDYHACDSGCILADTVRVTPSYDTPAEAAKWTVSIPSEATWLSVNKAEGTSAETLTFIAEENTGATSRSCTVTFKGYGGETTTCTVTQLAKNTFGINPETLEFKAIDDPKDVTVTSADTSWTYSCSDWIHGTKSGDKTKLTVTVDNNTGDTRNGDVIFTYYLGRKCTTTKTLTVTQGTLQAQTDFKFDPNTATAYVMKDASNKFTQTPTGNKTSPVTYSVNSDNTAGATINASTGEVTYTKPGVVVITATAPSSAEWQEAKATLVLTVKVKYKKVTTLEPGYQYIIVSNDRAMQNSSGSLSGLTKENNFSFDGNDLILNNDDTSTSLLWTVSKHYDSAATLDSYAIGYALGNNNYYLHAFNGDKTSQGEPALYADMNVHEVSGDYSTHIFKYGGTSLTFNPRDEKKEYEVYYSTLRGKFYSYNLATCSKNSDIYVSPILNKIDVSSVTISGGTSPVPTTQGTMQLTATVSPANAYNTIVKWTSSNTSVATVNEYTGLVTVKGKGTTTITAMSEDGTASDTFSLTVRQMVQSISVTPSATTGLKVGSTIQLSASVSPSEAEIKTLTWSSSDNNVATVSSSGLVTAVSPGDVTITASSTDGSGVTGTATVEVIGDAQQIKSVSPSSIIFSADGKKYYYEGSSWNNTAPAYVTVTTDDSSKQWSVSTSGQLGSGACYDNGSLKIPAPSAITSWSAGPKDGIVTVTGAKGGNSMNVSLHQNRPLTVTGENRSTSTNLSPAYTLTMFGNVEIKIDYNTDSGLSYSTDSGYSLCCSTEVTSTSNSEVTIKQSYYSLSYYKEQNWNSTVTISNGEGDSYKVTINNYSAKNSAKMTIKVTSITKVN